MECRLGLKSDKQNVIEAFPGLYGGTDFLPSEFDNVMENPQNTCFVGELQGQIVSFMCTKVLDGGTSYLVRSQRVANEYMRNILRGSRIYSKLAYWSTEESLKKIQRHLEREIIKRQVLLWYTLSIDDLDHKLSSFTKEACYETYHLNIIEPGKITNAQRGEIMRYLSNSCADSDDVLCVHWTPYGNYNDNWDDILNNISWIATNSFAKHSTMKYLIFVKQYLCRLGLRYDVQFLCPSESLEEIDQKMVHGVFSKISSEQHGFTGKTAIFCFSDEEATKVLCSQITKIIGNDIPTTIFEVFYMKEELKDIV